MNTDATLAAADSKAAQRRIAACDWTVIGAELDGSGYAVLKKLLTPEECRAIASLYPHEEHFRSRVHMARHGFGKGEYQYFKYPLPKPIGELRTALYSHIAPFANDWNERIGAATRYPKQNADFLKVCHDAGQTRPTPLLLHTVQATTIACIRTFTASSCSRCRSPFCCHSPGGISPAANSF
jgi:uncharacterized protein